MTYRKKKRIDEALQDLAADSDTVLAAAASAFVSTPRMDHVDPQDPQKEITERLFALISRQLESDADPTKVTDALVAIDTHLADRAEICGPFACRFSSTAAALMIHLAQLRQKERFEAQCAADAPIFGLDKKTLCAVLHTPIGRLGAAIYAERVLLAVLKKRPSRLRFIVRMPEFDAAEIADAWTAMMRDLKAQGIYVSLDESSPASLRSTQSDKDT